jgi:hypothetical protein
MILQMEVFTMTATISVPAARPLRPLYRTAATPLRDDFAARPYAEVRIPGVPPRSFDLFRSLPDAVIDAVIRAGVTVEVRSWGGAIGRPTRPR